MQKRANIDICAHHSKAMIDTGKGFLRKHSLGLSRCSSGSRSYYCWGFIWPLYTDFFIVSSVISVRLHGADSLSRSILNYYTGYLPSDIWRTPRNSWTALPCSRCRTEWCFSAECSNAGSGIQAFQKKEWGQGQARIPVT